MLHPSDLDHGTRTAADDDAELVDLASRRRSGRPTSALRAPAAVPFNGTPTVAQMDHIIERYREGRPLEVVAAELEFTVEAVHRSLRRSGLLRPEDFDPRPRPSPELDHGRGSPTGSGRSTAPG